MFVRRTGDHKKMFNPEFYQLQIDKYTAEREKAHRKFIVLGTARLIVFTGLIFFGITLWASSHLFWLFPLLIALFLYLVHRSADARYERSKAEKMIQINEWEQLAIAGDHSSFADGSQFKDSSHPFSEDIDLYGKGSLFQLVNRTVTIKGEKALSNRLSKGIDDPLITNKAIEYFSKQTDWCQQFRAEALIEKEENKELRLQDILRFEMRSNGMDRILLILVPIISIVSTILFALDLINGFVFSGILITILGLVGKKLKVTNRICFGVLQFEPVVKVYLKQLELLKGLKFEDDELQEWKNKTLGKEADIIRALESLNSLQNRMSFRSNILVGVLLNIYLAWDFRMLNDWARWRDTFGNGLGGIEGQFAEMEVWLTGAAYLNNHNDGIFAKIGVECSPNIEELRHPFISFNRAVRNDFHLTETEQFHIITGPNMAGKSTYLRSVAWAIVCANAGFPVLASSCELPKFSLYTSMRTSDDLSGNSSYFHAELMRLRFIVDAILNREKVFVILDEILKGTNSKDKEEGSAAFLEKLVRIGGVGIIATHDLSLCRLADRSSVYRNMYFDSTINGQELSFDYQIREGVCKNMNASFLLRKMELID
jgi:hypothetical protein